MSKTLQKAVELKRLLQQGQEYPVELLDEIINEIDALEYESKQEVKVNPVSGGFFPREEDLI